MSIPPDLPPDLKAVLETLVHGVSRNAMAKRVAAQSRVYRAGGASDIIASADDALAYALARLPATYAATTAVLNALCEGLPTLHPRTVLDVGAGPGGASFAASAMFAGIDEFRMIDANPDLRRLALTLMAGADSASLRHAAGDHAYQHGDALTLLAGVAPADLVIASYVAGEIADLDLTRFAHALWRATAAALAIIEPGTPTGYGRILRMRDALIGADAYVAAPCPHARACPLPAPDWCHFAQRLPRSRDHLRVKGAEVPFEDEKFAYVVLSRGAPQAIDARVLAPPHVTKSAVTTQLCTAGGIVTDTVARRHGEAYRRRKSWRWGDSVALREGKAVR
jgi:ribosomal protein RSM22 (predicted rRNA methylase)